MVQKQTSCFCCFANELKTEDTDMFFFFSTCMYKVYVEWVLQEESLSLTKAHGKSTFGQKEFL